MATVANEGFLMGHTMIPTMPMQVPAMTIPMVPIQTMPRTIPMAIPSAHPFQVHSVGRPVERQMQSGMYPPGVMPVATRHLHPPPPPPLTLPTAPPHLSLNRVPPPLKPPQPSKFFQETSEESFEESLMAGGYGKYRTQEWTRQPQSGIPPHSQSQSKSTTGALPPSLSLSLPFSLLLPLSLYEVPAEPVEMVMTEKETRKRKRLAAFHSHPQCEDGDGGLRVVTMEGMGRVLSDRPVENFATGVNTGFGSGQGQGQKKYLFVNSTGSPTATLTPGKNGKRKGGKAEDGGGGVGGKKEQMVVLDVPNWVDGEFPWKGRAEERKCRASEEQKERFRRLEVFLDEDVAEQEEDGFIPPRPRATTTKTMEERLDGSRIPRGDPADARNVLGVEKTLKGLKERRERRGRRRRRVEEEAEERRRQRQRQPPPPPPPLQSKRICRCGSRTGYCPDCAPQTQQTRRKATKKRGKPRQPSPSPPPPTYSYLREGGYGFEAAFDESPTRPHGRGLGTGRTGRFGLVAASFVGGQQDEEEEEEEETEEEEEHHSDSASERLQIPVPPKFRRLYASGPGWGNGSSGSTSSVG